MGRNRSRSRERKGSKQRKEDDMNVQVREMVPDDLDAVDFLFQSAMGDTIVPGVPLTFYRRGWTHAFVASLFAFVCISIYHQLLPILDALIVAVVLLFLFFLATKYLGKLTYWGYMHGSYSSDMKDPIKYYVQHPKRNFIVATLNQQVVGCLAAERNTSDDCGPFGNDRTNWNKLSDLELRRVGVDPRIRGKGIGTKMIEYIEQWAKANDFKREVLTTSAMQVDAVHFYQKKGFTLEKIAKLQMIPFFGRWIYEDLYCFSKPV